MPLNRNRLFVPFLVVTMLVTGVANILLSKYQDQQCVRNCSDGDEGQPETFKQPVVQTVQMFIGEMGCWLVTKGIATISKRLTKSTRRQSYVAITTTDEDEDSIASSYPDVLSSPLTLPYFRVWRPRSRAGQLLLLSIPTLFDICGTTLMNAGLLFIVPSVYQMTRGLVVLFVGCFSFVFLGRRLRSAQYLSIVGIVLGVAIAGTAGVLNAKGPETDIIPMLNTPRDTLNSSDATYAAVGILLVSAAQVFTASQLVIEEWILAGSFLQPTDVIGYEGLLGILLMTTMTIALYLAVGREGLSRLGPLDIFESWRQLTTVTPVLVSGILVTISVGVFNFSGLAVTKHISATSRSIIDTSRTIFIWTLSLTFGWETFKWLQAVGFLVLLYSNLLFHGIVELPAFCTRVEAIHTEGLHQETETEDDDSS